MHLYGNIPSIPSFGILILFSLYLGLYPALFGALVAALHAKYSRNLVLLAVPFLWVAVELARARITGFPWDLLGYTQVDNLALTRLAPWTGVMGISFVIAAVNALWLVRPESTRLKYLPASIALLLTAAATLATALPTKPLLRDHRGRRHPPAGKSRCRQRKNRPHGNQARRTRRLLATEPASPHRTYARPPVFADHHLAGSSHRLHRYRSTPAAIHQRSRAPGKRRCHRQRCHRGFL